MSAPGKMSIRPRISAVIPTRNRPDSLKRLLNSLERQTVVPDEIIIVDSSDDPLQWDVVRNQFPRLTIRGFRKSVPSVCAQRNLGVTEAKGDYVFLCDDDMVAGPDYVANLSEFLYHHQDTVVVSGMIIEPGISESDTHPLPPLSLRGLLWKTLFLQSVWADLARVPFPRWLRWVRGPVMAYYQKRDNTFTPAGWPLVTNVSNSFFETAFYGLGASMVRRAFLLTHPFSMVLGAHGIGDNYGLAVHLLSSGKKIVVLGDTSVHHYKSPVDRLPLAEAHYWRVIALDLFLDGLPRWHIPRRILLLWSLVGNFLAFTATGKFLRVRFLLKAFVEILLRRNPYHCERHMKQISGARNPEQNQMEIRS